MPTRKTISSIVLVSLLSLHGSEGWDYMQNGKDWPSTCSGNGQAPIDLQSSMAQTPSNEDDFQKHYLNIDSSEVHLQENQGLVLELPTYSEARYCKNYLVSKYGQGLLDSSKKKFTADQVMFRAQSEHTIDGQRKGLELQITHQKDDLNSVLSILFDTASFDDSISDDKIIIIDSFFENLKLTENQQKWNVEGVPFGELVSLADTENRWVYKAKQNVPPCEKDTYYNVVAKVLPIKEAHLQLVKAHISSIKGVPQAGNYRDTQSTNNQGLKLFYKDRTPKEPEVILDDFQQVLVDMFLAIFIIWIVIVVLAAVYLGYVKVTRKKEMPEEIASPSTATNRKGNQSPVPGKGKTLEQLASMGDAETGREMIPQKPAHKPMLTASIIATLEANYEESDKNVKGSKEEGFITRSDLAELLKGLGKGYTEEDAQSMINVVSQEKELFFGFFIQKAKEGKV